MYKFMCIQEYDNIFGATPEIVFAGRYLESRGYIFGETYSIISAINLASLEIVDHLEFSDEERYGFGV